MTIDLVSKKDSKKYERGRPLDFGRHNSTRSTQAELDMVFSASFKIHLGHRFLDQTAIVQVRQEEKYILGSIPSFMEAAVTSQIKGAQTK